MHTEFKYKSALTQLSDAIAHVPDGMEKEAKRTVKELQGKIKRRVESELLIIATDRKDAEYRHMYQDVVTKDVGGKDKIGTMVMGGKKTAFKWHMVNDGTSKSRPTHFIDKAMQKSSRDIESAIDALLSNAMGDI